MLLQRQKLKDSTKQRYTYNRPQTSRTSYVIYQMVPFSMTLNRPNL